MVVACAAATQTPERLLVSCRPAEGCTLRFIPPMLLPPIISCGVPSRACAGHGSCNSEYQAALKADPASQAVKARLAGLYFSLGDHAQCRTLCGASGRRTGQDSQLLTQMAGILASAGQGERALGY